MDRIPVLPATFPTKKFNSPTLVSLKIPNERVLAGIILNSVTLCFRDEYKVEALLPTLISVSAFASISSLSIMPMLVTRCEMENCPLDFKIPNQIETSLKCCCRQ